MFLLLYNQALDILDHIVNDSSILHTITPKILKAVENNPGPVVQTKIAYWFMDKLKLYPFFSVL